MTLSFVLLAERYAVARLDAGAPIPQWARGRFVSITRTPDELSVVCAEDSVPQDVRADRGWRCLALQGPFALEITGVAAEFTGVLARAAVSVFVVATFDTDYVLIPGGSLERATAALRLAGHDVSS